MTDENKPELNEEMLQRYLYNIVDEVYRDVQHLTTGNLAHNQACILHDIRALKNNISYFWNKKKNQELIQ